MAIDSELKKALSELEPEFSIDKLLELDFDTELTTLKGLDFSIEAILGDLDSELDLSADLDKPSNP